MSEELIVVFTAKSIERILREGGTSSWRLDRNHARRCSLVVCTRNSYADWAEGDEPHRSAFLVGKVSNVAACDPTPENHESPEIRYLIQFSEFARVNVPDVWKGDRNPVRYSTVEELGLDVSAFKWEVMPDAESSSHVILPGAATGATVQPLTIAEAKRALALTFNVAPEAVEITIRG
jgi:hypothetical protein